MNIIQRLLQPLLRTEAQRHLLYGRRKKALSLFELLCRWNDVPENRFNLALGKMNLRRYDDAIALLEPIHAQIPNQLFAGVTFGQCLLLAKRFSAAEELYQKLLETNPDSSLLRSLLAISQDPVGRDRFASSLDLQFQASLLEEERKPEEALTLLQKAVGLTPDDAALHNNLGALKLKLKHPTAQVMEEFQKAMHLSPDNDRYKRNYRRVWAKSQK